MGERQVARAQHPALRHSCCSFKRNKRCRQHLQNGHARLHLNCCLLRVCTLQEEFVRSWARTRTGLECNFKVAFYPGRYAAEKGEQRRGGGGGLHCWGIAAGSIEGRSTQRSICALSARA